MRRSLFLGAAMALTLATTAWAQTEPADSMIKGALYDIERAEQQLPGLSPSRAANIKRLERSIQMTEERLAESPNQDHPSWIEASQRLEAVKQALAAIVGGGQPAAPAETPATATPAEPAAPATQAAPAEPAAPATQAVPTEAAGPDPEIERARRELDMITAQARSMREGDAGLAQRFLGDLARIQQTLTANADQSHADWPGIVTYHGEVTGAMNSHIVKSLTANLVTLAEYVDGMQPLQYLVADDVAYVRNGLGTIATDLAALNAPEQEDVKDLAGKIQQINTLFEERVSTAEAEHATLGDVPAQVAEIEQRAFGLEVPESLVPPLTEDGVLAYANQLKQAWGHIEADVATLNKIDGKSPMSVEDGNRFRRMQGYLAYEKPQAIQTSWEHTNYAVDAWVQQYVDALDWANETDPDDVNHRSNRLLGEGQFEETVARLEEGIGVTKIAAVYDSQFTRDGAPDRNAQIAAFEDGIRSLSEKRNTALSGNRMPDSQSDDPALLEAAAEVLARPENGFAFDRMVINYGLNHREKTTGDIDAGTTSATVTLYDFSWDEFQATTAEKVGDKYFMFINSFRYYYSGGERTVLNKWILYDRFQSQEILAENIQE